MLLTDGMKKATYTNNDATDDNEESFIALAALTANVVRYLEGSNQQKEEGCTNDRKPEQGGERSEKTQREYIEYRLREVAQFEARARGDWRPPRRGPAKPP